MASGQDNSISETVQRETTRLKRFIQRRVADRGEAEDILQDVFYELVEAYRLMKPIEQMGAWLFQVARSKITDSFRKKKPQPLPDIPEGLSLEELLPSLDEGPDAAYVRAVLLEEIEAALDELPAEQREVFVAHEMKGRSFKEMADQTGVSVNTLLSRKRYAVIYLRERLHAIYQEFQTR